MDTNTRFSWEQKNLLVYQKTNFTVENSDYVQTTREFKKIFIKQNV